MEDPINADERHASHRATRVKIIYDDKPSVTLDIPKDFAYEPTHVIDIHYPDLLTDAKMVVYDIAPAERELH